MISRERLWWALSRDLRRGWKATYHYYKSARRIDRWSWPFPDEPLQPVPVHVLTSGRDWRLAAWMLASWFEATENRWPVVIHDDGTLYEAAQQTLLRLFPHARLILRPEADAAMARILQAFPFCWEHRQQHVFALKLFDVPYFTTGDRFLLFDSDALFFRHPREIVDWVASGRNECWFAEDPGESSLISASEAQEELGVRLWPHVNTGLGLLTAGALNFDFMDDALAQTSLLRGQASRIEQTLYALCASRFGRGGLLPSRYEVSLRKDAAEDVVARHYLRGDHDRFFSEGVKRLGPALLAPVAA